MPSDTPASQYTWLITGTSRGIGFEITKRLLTDPAHTVFATCRTPSKATALQNLAKTAKGTLHVIPLDVLDTQSIRDSVNHVAPLLGDRGLDYLINNAGINGVPDTAFTVDVELMQHIFKTNVVGPALISQVYLPYLEKSAKKTIVNVSSSLGSIGCDYHVAWSGYSITKSGLNMLTYKQQKERPDLTVVSVCPGWLKTDLGGTEAPLEVDVGVSGIMNVIFNLKPEDKGKFIEYTGKPVVW